MEAKFQRRIRSFVCREGRMTDRQQLALAQFWNTHVMPLPPGFFDLNTVFNRTAPKVVEIGFGMGQSLLAQAMQHPERDYLGIEVHRPGIGNLLAGMAEQQIDNIRLCYGDAVGVMQHIADNSLYAVQLFFPDPWPKRKHHKRRIVQIDFTELLQRKLQPDGYLHFATDWQEYAHSMLQILKATSGFVNQSLDGSYVPRPGARPLTKFEQRGQGLGHGVWDLIFVKKVVPLP
jgi:tRNA (guanine-N7-)-methyltransferase